jgi:siroheme synthase (precorrin-2 oxidase/ferrochelatase)
MGSSLPVTLIKLDARLGIVVGGGAVAERKARALLAAAARVRVVAPTLTNGPNHPRGIKVMLENGKVGRVQTIVEPGAATNGG